MKRRLFTGMAAAVTASFAFGAAQPATAAKRP